MKILKVAISSGDLLWLLYFPTAYFWMPMVQYLPDKLKAGP